MAHPLVDRRDLTAARERALVGEPAPSTSLDAGGLAHELAETNRLLRTSITDDRARIEQLCVTDREPAQAARRDFPVPGARRMIVHRSGNGSMIACPAGTPTPLLEGNEARLGGQIVVAGAAAVVLYLAGGVSGAPPQLWLAGGGGSWDLRLSSLLWCGRVLAVAQGASSQVSVAEV